MMTMVAEASWLVTQLLMRKEKARRKKTLERKASLDKNKSQRMKGLEFKV